MRRLSDSRHLSRTLAWIGLIAGPLLLLADTLIDPAWAADDAAYLREVAENRGVFIAAEVISTFGALIFIPGAIGATRLMRTQRVSLGQLGAGLLIVGLIGLVASLAFVSFDLAMADFGDREAATAIKGELEDGVVFRAYWLSFSAGGIVLGSVLLAVALFRRRIVPLWSPTLLLAAAAVWFAGGDEKALAATGQLMLAVALIPLAALIRSLSDDDWERWELPVGEFNKL
jgi:hypothetical protein